MHWRITDRKECEETEYYFHDYAEFEDFISVIFNAIVTANQRRTRQKTHENLSSSLKTIFFFIPYVKFQGN
jgi:hypothetical protein